MLWNNSSVKIRCKGQNFYGSYLVAEVVREESCIHYQHGYGEKIATAVAIWGSDPSEHCNVNLTRI